MQLGTVAPMVTVAVPPGTTWVRLKVADAPGAAGAVGVNGYSPSLFMWGW